MYLGWWETIAILVASLGAFVYARQVQQRSADPARPRLFDHTWIMFAAALVALLMVVHMFGLATGRPGGVS